MADVIPWLSKDPRAWGSVSLGKYTTPGIATVSVKRSNEVEVKKAKGGIGASTTLQGPNLAEVEIELVFLRQSELDAWFRLAPVLVAAKAASTSLIIKHPKTTGYGITEVTIQDVTDGHNKIGDQYPVKIKCVEWRPKEKGKTATKTETKLEPRNNRFNDKGAARDIQVARPSRDPVNAAPRGNDGKPVLAPTREITRRR